MKKLNCKRIGAIIIAFIFTVSLTANCNNSKSPINIFGINKDLEGIAAAASTSSFSVNKTKGYNISVSESLYDINALNTLDYYKQNNLYYTDIENTNVKSSKLDSNYVAEVKLSFTENCGFYGATIVLDFDEELTFVGLSNYSSGSFSSNKELTDCTKVSSNKGKISITYKAESNFTGEGEYFKLLFVLPNNPELNHAYRVGINDTETSQQIVPWEDGIVPEYSSNTGYILLTDKDISDVTTSNSLITTVSETEPVTTVVYTSDKPGNIATTQFSSITTMDNPITNSTVTAISNSVESVTAKLSTNYDIIKKQATDEVMIEISNLCDATNTSSQKVMYKFIELNNDRNDDLVIAGHLGIRIYTFDGESYNLSDDKSLYKLVEEMDFSDFTESVYDYICNNIRKSETTTTEQVTTPVTTIPIPNETIVSSPPITDNNIKGDVNNDGVINTCDFMTLRNCLISGSYTMAADVNQDGSVNVVDMMDLKRLLLKGEIRVTETTRPVSNTSITTKKTTPVTTTPVTTTPVSTTPVTTNSTVSKMDKTDTGFTVSDSNELYSAYYRILSSDKDFSGVNFSGFVNVNHQRYEQLIVPDLSKKNFKYYFCEDGRIYTHNFGCFTALSVQLYHNNDYIKYHCGYLYKIVEGYFDPVNGNEINTLLKYTENGSGYNVEWTISSKRNNITRDLYNGTSYVDEIYKIPDNYTDMLYIACNETGFTISKESNFEKIDCHNPEETIKLLYYESDSKMYKTDTGVTASDKSNLYSAYYKILSSDEDFRTPNFCGFVDVNNQGYEQLIVPDLSQQLQLNFKYYFYEDGHIYSHNFGRFTALSSTKLYIVDGYIGYSCSYAYQNNIGCFNPANGDEINIILKYTENGSGYNCEWTIYSKKNNIEIEKYNGTDFVKAINDISNNFSNALHYTCIETGFPNMLKKDSNEINCLTAEAALSKLNGK